MLELAIALNRRIDLRFMMGLAGGLAAFQLLCAWLFRRQIARELGEPPPSALPPTAVVVPCKGASEALARNAGSLLDQDFPGRLEHVFVVPCLDDPAFPVLERAVAARSRRARLLVSDAVPTRCSEKNLNILCGLRAVDPAAEVLLFADADILVGRDWAARLVGALQEPGVGAATTATFCVPTRVSPWPLLRLVWVAAGLPFFRLVPRAVGQSMAMRRADFERLGVAGRWARCVSEDAAVDHAVKSSGLRVRYVPGASPVSPEECGPAACLRVLNNWFVYARIYDRAAWALLASAILGKTWLLFWALRRPGPRAGLLAVELGG
ncbi:MAG: glycosyltransferase, partial [Elusimicrobia bacterium]|nr:glycosyltransferase [Elusimicrobiota bacterium]